MGRIMALDFGKKRTGIAVTDPQQWIATGLTTVWTQELIPYLQAYLKQEPVDLFVVGEPRNLDGSSTDGTQIAAEGIRVLRRHFPEIPVRTCDERLSSVMARKSLLESGVRKSERRNKALVDEVSATILLQGYLQGQTN